MAETLLGIVTTLVLALLGAFKHLWSHLNKTREELSSELADVRKREQECKVTQQRLEDALSYQAAEMEERKATIADLQEQLRNLQNKLDAMGA